MGRSAEEKDCVWDQMLSVTRSIQASELIIVGWDLNGHGLQGSGGDAVQIGMMEFMMDMALESEMWMMSDF